MKVIEATASRSLTLKVPKLDYRGEERFRPHEDAMIHAGLKATLDNGEDAGEAQRSLQKMVDDMVEEERAKTIARHRALQAAADTPATMDRKLPTSTVEVRACGLAGPTSMQVHVPADAKPHERLEAVGEALAASQSKPTIDGDRRSAALKRLRTAGARFTEITGEPVTRPVPTEVAAMEALASELEAAIAEMERTRKKADQREARRDSAQERKRSLFEAHTSPNYPQGKDMPAGQRRCSHGTLPEDRAKPCGQALDSGGYNYSINVHGRPLCKIHDPNHRPK